MSTTRQKPRTTIQTSRKIVQEGTFSEEWVIENEYGRLFHHRTDGPAVVSRNYEGWYAFGEFHREGGAAREWTNGGKEYWIHNHYVTEEEYWAQMPRRYEREDGGEEWYLPDGRLHREYGPALKDSEREEWHWEGNLHRDLGPAVTLSSGREEWWFHGQRHRLGGPAVVMPGRLEYWEEGKLVRVVALTSPLQLVRRKAELDVVLGVLGAESPLLRLVLGVGAGVLLDRMGMESGRQVVEAAFVEVGRTISWEVVREMFVEEKEVEEVG